MAAKLILVIIPANDPGELADFYSQIMGVGFARSFTDRRLCFYAPVSSDGVFLQVVERWFEDEPITCHFAVDDLTEAITTFTRNGGEVIVEPTDIPIAEDGFSEYRAFYREFYKVPTGSITASMGTFAMVRDIAGNRLGLIELAEHAHREFKVGHYAEPVSDERLAYHERMIERTTDS